MSYIKKISCLFSLLLIFVSCSQVSPELNFSSGTVVFEFENENELSSARLSVFLDVSSDEHRAESMKLEYLANGFEWETSSPLKFENGNRKYTGCTNLVMPNSDAFPQGRYKVTYIDANDEVAEISLDLSYNNDIFTMKAADVPAYMNGIGGTEFWAVYDETGILVFYGQKQNEMMNIENVWRKYSVAKYIRTVWVSPGSRTMCIMPRIYKIEEEGFGAE